MTAYDPAESDYLPSEPHGSPPDVFRWDKRLELACVVLLSVASLIAAWSGYQATAWGGEQSARFAEAATRRVESTRASTNANIFAIRDASLFSGWAEAYVAGNQQLMDFYEARFSPELAVAMDAWVATDPLENPDAPAAPYAMPEYANPEMERASQLEAEAEILFDAGMDSNQRSDRYVLSTVLAASVLFFAGLATKITWFPLRVGTVALASVILLYVVASLVTYPVA
jgi:hypothetical protein